MGDVKTLVTLVLGGMFDHRELGDIDLVYEAPACEALQRELVESIEDVHVELVSRIDYDAKCHAAEVYFGSWKRTEEERDAAQAELAALHGLCGDRFNELAALREELVKANKDRETLLKLHVHLRARRSYWIAEATKVRRDLTAAEQRNADTEKLLRECKHEFCGDNTTLTERIDALLAKPTESGASE